MVIWKKKITNTVPLAVLFVLMLVIHLKMSLNLSDDSIFSQILNEKTLFSHISDLYLNVNGKILPDTMAAIFTYLPHVFFCVVSSTMYVVIAYSISVLFLKDDLYSRAFASLGVLYLPASLLTSAGYVATSTNYVWTSAALLFSFIPLRMFLKYKKINVFHVIIFTLSTIYAGNQEQSCVLLLIVYFGFLVWSKVNKIQRSKANSALLYYVTILGIASLLFILTAPGHIKRSMSEYGMFSIPNWTSLDIIDKLYLGMNSTVTYFVNQINILYLLMTLALMILVVKKCHKWYYQLIGIVSFSIPFLFSGEVLHIDKLYNISHYSYPWGYGSQIFTPMDANNYTCLPIYLPIIVSMLVVFCILFSFHLVADNMQEFTVYSTVFLLGILSRMAMCFSATLFGSSFRTFIYMYFSFIILLVILFYRLFHEKREFAFNFIYIAGGLYSYIVSFYGIV